MSKVLFTSWKYNITTEKNELVSKLTIIIFLGIHVNLMTKDVEHMEFW